MIFGYHWECLGKLRGGDGGDDDDDDDDDADDDDDHDHDHEHLQEIMQFPIQ